MGYGCGSVPDFDRLPPSERDLLSPGRAEQEQPSKAAGQGVAVTICGTALGDAARRRDRESAAAASSSVTEPSTSSSACGGSMVRMMRCQHSPPGCVRRERPLHDGDPTSGAQRARGRGASRAPPLLARELVEHEGEHDAVVAIPELGGGHVALPIVGARCSSARGVEHVARAIDRGDLGAGSEKALRDRPGAASDLEHPVARSQLERRHELVADLSDARWYPDDRVDGVVSDGEQ